MTDLEIILETMPESARGGSLAKLWPSDSKNRKVSKPVIFHLEGGYLEAANFSSHMPSVREAKYECLSPQEALSFLLERCDLEDTTEDAEQKVGKKVSEWSTDDLGVLESVFDDYLSREVDPDELGMWEAISYNAYGLAVQLWEELDPELRSLLDLDLVEGEHPGSSFVGVEYLGSADTLNHALAKAGLNMVVK